MFGDVLAAVVEPDVPMLQLADVRQLGQVPHFAVLADDEHGRVDVQARVVVCEGHSIPYRSHSSAMIDLASWVWCMTEPICSWLNFFGSVWSSASGRTIG